MAADLWPTTSSSLKSPSCSPIPSEIPPPLLLPKEIWGEIFKRTDEVTCLVASRVCKAFIPFSPHKDDIPFDFCRKAAGRGYTRVMEWGQTEGYPLDGKSCAQAAANGGHRRTLEWLINNKKDPLKWEPSTDRYNIAELAALCNHVGLIKLVSDFGVPPKRDTIFPQALGYEEYIYNDTGHRIARAEARGGHTGLLEYLKRKKTPLEFPPFDQSSIWHTAVHYGHLKFLRVLERQGYLIDKMQAMLPAISSGNIDMLEYLYPDNTNMNPLDSQLCEWASESGNLNVLIWLRDRGCQWDRQRCLKAAAELGDTTVLQYILNNGDSLTLDPSISFSVASSGNLDALKLLIDGGCPLNIEDCAVDAAKKGHLHILNYLEQKTRERSLKRFSASLYQSAIQGGRLEFLKELAKRKYPFDIEKCAEIAAQEGRIKTLKWLIEEQGYLLNETMCFLAAMYGHWNLLKWLIIERGCPFDVEECAEIAIRYGQIKTLEWLTEEQGYLLNETTCMKAAEHGEESVLVWLVDEKNCPWNPAVCLRVAQDLPARTELESLRKNKLINSIRSRMGIDWIKIVEAITAVVRIGMAGIHLNGKLLSMANSFYQSYIMGPRVRQIAH